MKDYYAILGVSPNAEPEVISAAYKSLAKKYHPDIYQGTKKEAETRIREINEAYSNLSNKTKKDKYDREYSKNKTAGSFDDFSNNEFDENLDIFDKDWEILIEVFPKAEKLRHQLSKLSQKLSLLFQVIVLEKKLGKRVDTVARELKKEFLERYFGKSTRIQDLATKALVNNEIDIAKEINKKITLLGNDASEEIYEIIHPKLKEKLKDKETYSKSKNRQNSTKTNEAYQKIVKSSQQRFIILLLISLAFFVTLLFSYDPHNESFIPTKYCTLAPGNCDNIQLCMIATERINGKLVWNLEEIEYVNAAIGRGLLCSTD